MTAPLTICTERTVELVRPSVLNPLRRLLRRPLPTYTSHLFADAVVAMTSGEPPTLSIERDDRDRLRLRLVWPSGAAGFVTRCSVRERGADRPWSGARLVHDHQPDESASPGWTVSPGGRLRDPVTTALVGGSITVNDARRVMNDELTLDEAVETRRAIAVEDEAQADHVPLHVTADGGAFGRVAVTTPEGTASLTVRADPGHSRFRVPSSAARLFWDGDTMRTLPGDAPPPTDRTTVLHDLRFIADQLELAQAQIAMTMGGADAGSVDNAAHVALCAVGLVQAKLEVVAEAADMAATATADAAVQVDAMAGPQAQRILKSAKSSLRFITDRLPLEKPAHV